jgi:hypothetical protein
MTWVKETERIPTSKNLEEAFDCVARIANTEGVVIDKNDDLRKIVINGILAK